MSGGGIPLLGRDPVPTLMRVSAAGGDHEIFTVSLKLASTAVSSHCVAVSRLKTLLDD